MQVLRLVYTLCGLLSSFSPLRFQPAWHQGSSPKASLHCLSWWLWVCFFSKLNKILVGRNQPSQILEHLKRPRCLSVWLGRLWLCTHCNFDPTNVFLCIVRVNVCLGCHNDIFTTKRFPGRPILFSVAMRAQTCVKFCGLKWCVVESGKRDVVRGCCWITQISVV